MIYYRISICERQAGNCHSYNKVINHSPVYISIFSSHTTFMTRQNIFKLTAKTIFFFFLASVLGYLWEVILLLFQDGSFHNRGFLYGPWLPVYGIGAITFFLLLRKWRSYPIRVFFFSALLGGTLELAVGWLLAHFWHTRYWDYSENVWNLNGYICLYSVFGFGIAGVFWVCLLSRLCGKLWHRMPKWLQTSLLTILLILFITDCAAALIFPNMGKGITY